MKPLAPVSAMQSVDESSGTVVSSKPPPYAPAEAANRG